MAVQLISVKCPECRAKLSIEEGRTQAFCTYCGAKILLHNKNEHIIRHIDEASVKQAETERMIRLKELELEEKVRAAEAKRSSLKIKAGITLGLLCMISFVVAAFSKGDGTFIFMLIGLLLVFPIIFIWFGDESESPVRKTVSNFELGGVIESGLNDEHESALDDEPGLELEYEDNTELDDEDEIELDDELKAELEAELKYTKFYFDSQIDK